MSGARADYRDDYFGRRDLDWGGRWRQPFRGPLRTPTWTRSSSSAAASGTPRRGLPTSRASSDYVLEETGQTVRFFLRELLEHVEIRPEQTGEPCKRVWRGMEQRR